MELDGGRILQEEAELMMLDRYVFGRGQEGRGGEEGEGDWAGALLSQARRGVFTTNILAHRGLKTVPVTPGHCALWYLIRPLYGRRSRRHCVCDGR